VWTVEGGGRSTEGGGVGWWCCGVSGLCMVRMLLVVLSHSVD